MGDMMGAAVVLSNFTAARGGNQNSFYDSSGSDSSKTLL
jgi:hypothetical protein